MGSGRSGRRVEGSGGARGSGRNGAVPPAFVCIAEAAQAGAAAALAIGQGERDLAAGIVAERIRLGDAFEARYGVPWDAAWTIIMQADGAKREPVAVPARVLLRALADRLGYRDGILGLDSSRDGREGESGDENDSLGARQSLDDWFLDGVGRSPRVVKAYRRGRGCGIAERWLVRRAPEVAAVVDARADVLRAWVLRFESAARWVLRRSVARRLVAGRRIERAIAHAGSQVPREESSLVVWALKAYALGKARALRQLAARRLVDVREARASASWEDGTEIVAAELQERLSRARRRLRAARAGLQSERRRELEAMVREARLDLAVVRGLGSGAHGAGAATGARAAEVRLVWALATASGGRAWARAISPRLPHLAPTVRSRADGIEDPSGRRLALAECELIATGAKPTLIAAEGWAWAYREEADGTAEGSVERRTLMAQAEAIERALDRRAGSEARHLFYAVLASERQRMPVADADSGGIGADERERLLDATHRVIDRSCPGLSSLGAQRSVDAWVARVRQCVEREAGLWGDDRLESHRLGRFGRWLGWVLYDVQEWCIDAWEWLDGRSALEIGSGERPWITRFVRGRALLVFGVLTMIGFAWLKQAAPGRSLIGAAVALAIAFAAGVWKMANQDDPHWWRSGVITLGLVLVAGSTVGDLTQRSADPLLEGRMHVAANAWLLMMPFALGVARWTTRGRRRVMRSRS